MPTQKRSSRKSGRRIYPHEILLEKGRAGLPRDSLVLAHQIRTIDKARLQSVHGTISDAAIRAQVQEALRIHLDL